MARQWQGSERRQHPRIAIHGTFAGRIQSALEAPLIDLSLSGALVEMPSALPATMRYSLRLPLEGGAALELEADVVRSYVHGFERQKSGQPAVMYRTALRFVDVDDSQRAGLEAILERGVAVGLRAELS